MSKAQSASRKQIFDQLREAGFDWPVLEIKCLERRLRMADTVNRDQSESYEKRIRELEAEVERLRSRNACRSCQDENARLTRDNASLSAHFSTACDRRDHWKVRAEAAEAEVERLRAGGCARDQRTTQFCAEAARLQDKLEAVEGLQRYAVVGTKRGNRYIKAAADGEWIKAAELEALIERMEGGS